MDTFNTMLRKPDAPLGTFSEDDIQDFLDKTSFTPQELKAYATIQQLNKHEMSALLGKHLDDRTYYLIKEAGLEAAALLVREFDWRLLPITKQSDNYMKSVISLDDNPDFCSALTGGERSALRFIANAYRDVLHKQTTVKFL